jgi:hypothetical protein
MSFNYVILAKKPYGIKIIDIIYKCLLTKEGKQNIINNCEIKTERSCVKLSKIALFMIYKSIKCNNNYILNGINLCKIPDDLYDQKKWSIGTRIINNDASEYIVAMRDGYYNDMEGKMLSINEVIDLYNKLL